MLRIENLHMNYGEAEILKGINLTVDSNEIICILGRNGQGKTTLLNIISGICNQNKGTIEINGYERIKHEKEYKKLLGYVPDGIKPFEYLTINQYLEFILSVYDCEIKDEELKEKIKLLELDEQMNKKIKILSKGNKKKVLILTSFLHNPKVLMLDEPLDGIDLAVQPGTLKLIKNLKKNTAILIVTHSMQVVEELADRVVILSNGIIIEDSSIDNLYRKYNSSNMLEIYLMVIKNE